MKNLFKNAKFGDKFRTRNGRMAIFCCKLPASSLYRLVIDGFLYSSNFNEFGSYNPSYCDSCFDIIGKWEEPINEEELDKLAEHHCKEIEQLGCKFNSQERLIVMDSFKAGCKEAFKRS